MKAMRAATGAGRILSGISLAAVLAGLSIPAGAAETVKIYRSSMPDGTVVLSDKPTTGAKSVASDTFVLTAPRGAAEAERDYWRRQAEAFNRRQEMRDGEQRPSIRSSRPSREEFAMYREPEVIHHGYHAAQPLVSLSRVPPNYASSPGAARGREGGFIGSGFSSAR